MKTGIKILVAFVVFLVVLIGTAFTLQGPPKPRNFVDNRTFENFTNLLYNYEITRYYSDVEVVQLNDTNNVLIGVVVDTWNLKFGIVPSNGSYAKRNMILTNLKEIPTRINFEVYGDIAPHVQFSQNNFVIDQGERVSIDIYLFTNNTGIGNYTGEIDVIAKKPKYGFVPV